MSSWTIDSIIESFLNSSIPKIQGDPTFETIKNTEKLLVENVSIIQSTLGGGEHGYLGLF